MGKGLLDYAAQMQQEPQEPQEQMHSGLAVEQEREREAKARTLEVYQRWQHNTVITGDLQRQLLQGVKNGQSYAELLLIASKALSLATDNDLIFSQVAREIERRGDAEPNKI